MDNGPDLESRGPLAHSRAQMWVWVAAAGVLGEWLGFHWDIAWHGDRGRDRFLTPPHVMIVLGILVTFAAGAYVVARVASGPLRERIRLEPGAAVVALGGVLTGTTLAVDNWWHGQFGTDVAVWSPPHLMLGVSFLIGALGILVEFTRRRVSAVWLAVLAGGFFAISTILLVEYEFGYPHFRILWSPIALALLFGFAVALSSSLSRHPWAGSLMAGSALMLRLVALGVNAAAGRSLSTPPLGVLAGGIVFDLVRRTMRRHSGEEHHRPRTDLMVAIVAAWAATFLVQIPWLRAAGKTWWVDGILLPAGLLGTVAALFGGALGRSIGRRLRALSSTGSDEGRPLGKMSSAQVLFAGALLSSVISVTAYQFTGGHDVRWGTYDARGASVAVTIPHSRSTDWVSAIGPRDPLGIFGSTPVVAVRPIQQVLDALELTWLGGLEWKDGTFRGDVKGTGEVIGVWYVGGDAVWAGLVQRGTAGPLVLIHQAFRPAVPPPAWVWVFGIGLIVLLVEASILLVAVALSVAASGSRRSSGQQEPDGSATTNVGCA